MLFQTTELCLQLQQWKTNFFIRKKNTKNYSFHQCKAAVVDKRNANDIAPVVKLMDSVAQTSSTMPATKATAPASLAGIIVPATSTNNIAIGSKDPAAVSDAVHHQHQPGVVEAEGNCCDGNRNDKFQFDFGAGKLKKNLHTQLLTLKNMIPYL